MASPMSNSQDRTDPVKPLRLDRIEQAVGASVLLSRTLLRSIRVTGFPGMLPMKASRMLGTGDAVRARAGGRRAGLAWRVWRGGWPRCSVTVIWTVLSVGLIPVNNVVTLFE